MATKAEWPKRHSRSLCLVATYIWKHVNQWAVTIWRTKWCQVVDFIKLERHLSPNPGLRPQIQNYLCQLSAFFLKRMKRRKCCDAPCCTEDHASLHRASEDTGVTVWKDLMVCGHVGVPLSALQPSDEVSSSAAGVPHHLVEEQAKALRNPVTTSVLLHPDNPVVVPHPFGILSKG